jgi:5-methylcytosine-specific restriction endonuclease McrA
MRDGFDFDTPDEHGSISYSGVRRPRRSSGEFVSRVYAREWFWRTHDRESYECPDCGRGDDRVQRFEVHHIDSDPTNNEPENLVAVCRRCHRWRHGEGPTVSGLDLDEWKDEFLSLGEDSESLLQHTVYDREEVTE